VDLFLGFVYVLDVRLRALSSSRWSLSLGVWSATLCFLVRRLGCSLPRAARWLLLLWI
jgi:hypothetical protein